jgi:hypothetical protein
MDDDCFLNASWLHCSSPLLLLLEIVAPWTQESGRRHKADAAWRAARVVALAPCLLLAHDQVPPWR